MDTYDIKWTLLQRRIFRFLCVNAGQTFNLREIAKSLKVSPTAVGKSIDNLKKEGLAVTQKSKTMNLVTVRFNRDNEFAIDMKRAENLRLIYESGLSYFLQEEFPGCAVVLFGSYSLGEDAWFGKPDERNSDIDIAIIRSKNKDIDISGFEKYLKREIRINFYPSWGKIHDNLKNNILNGIILSGRVEL